VSDCRWKPYSSSRIQCQYESDAAGALTVENVEWRLRVKREAEQERKRKRDGRELRWQMISGGEREAMTATEAELEVAS